MTETSDFMLASAGQFVGLPPDSAGQFFGLPPALAGGERTFQLPSAGFSRAFTTRRRRDRSDGPPDLSCTPYSPNTVRPDPRVAGSKPEPHTGRKPVQQKCSVAILIKMKLVSEVVSSHTDV